MRVSGIALALAFAVGLALGASNAAPNPPPQVSAAPADAPASNSPAVTPAFKHLADAYRSHRPAFAQVSDYSGRMRSNRLTSLGAFIVFVLLTVPFNTRGARAFYREMMAAAPLTAQEGVTDENNRQARQVLFFYLLFLLYQLVEYPLTFGHDNRVQFIADLTIQIGLVIAIAWSFHSLKRGMHQQWKADPQRQAKMDGWLNERLAGMRIRWRDIRMLAVGIFVVGFMPAVLSHLTGWLDAVADFGERTLGG